MANGDEVIQFDRRGSDVNVEALSLRMKGLEGRIEVLEEKTETTSRDLKTNTVELKDNTLITKEVRDAVFGVEGEFPGLAAMSRDVHGAVFGQEDKPGLQQLVQNISEIIETARGFFRWIGRVASGTGRVSDFISRSIKRFWWVIAAGIAIGTYVKTGRWEWPAWPG